MTHRITAAGNALPGMDGQAASDTIQGCRKLAKIAGACHGNEASLSTHILHAPACHLLEVAS